VAHVHPFLWRTRADAWCEAFDATDLSVSAAHDGYRRRHGVLHRRTVSLRPDHVAITDRLDGDRRCHVQLVFPLAPDLRAGAAGNGIVVSDGPTAIARLLPPAGLSARLVRGGPPASVGWHAIGYGQLVEADAVLVEGVVGPGELLRTTIALL
jgi:hypothetical protein